MALNTISLSGRMVADPEIRYTNSKKAVASFTIAVDRDGKDNGCDFINCVAWENTAQFINSYFIKGSGIIVVGRLQSRNYEDRNGNKRTAIEVVVNRAYFSGGKGTKPIEATKFEDVSDEETLPF